MVARLEAAPIAAILAEMSPPGRTAAFLAALMLLPCPAFAQRLGPDLEREMARGVGPAGLRVVVKLRDHDLPAYGSLRRGRIRARQDRVLAGMSRGGYEMRRRYDHLAGFAMRAGRSALRALERHPEVERVYLDRPVFKHLGESGDLIGSSISTLQGFTGAGVRVAVLDSGVDADHMYLGDDVVYERCWCGGGCCPPMPPGRNTASGPGSAEDDDGHGSAVSGIITSSQPGRLGVAPDAEIVALKVLDSNGSGSFSDIDSALNWVVANHATYDIRVVNMSLGDGQAHPNRHVFPCSGTVTASAIATLTAQGVTVVASSGNDGFTNGISMPACITGAIAVGGVYDADLGSRTWSPCTDSTTWADKLVCHTNRGSLLDVLAPDWRVVTTTKENGTKQFSGTSAAAPFVAATAALLYEYNPAYTSAGVRTLISGHGPLIPDPGSPSDEWPRLAPAEILTSVVFGADGDADGVSEDGDGSGTPGDDPCTGGNPWLCDDNCASLANAMQDDPGGVGNGSSPNGVGTDCECGDLNLSGWVDDVDVDDLRARLANPADPSLPPDFEDRCKLLTGGSGCGLVEVAVLLRNVNTPPLAPAIEPVCDAATGL
jgi:hypothetical protein